MPGLKDIPAAAAATADMSTLRTLSASWTKRSLEKVVVPELKNIPPAAATASAAATADMSTLRTYYLGRRVSFLLMILLLGKSARFPAPLMGSAVPNPEMEVRIDNIPSRGFPAVRHPLSKPH